MCCLFGLLDIKHNLSSREKQHILSILGTICEARGIDATGYSYVYPILKRYGAKAVISPITIHSEAYYNPYQKKRVSDHLTLWSKMGISFLFLCSEHRISIIFHLPYISQLTQPEKCCIQ